MKKMLVYPGSSETEVFIRYKSLLNGIERVVLAGPKGWTSPEHWNLSPPLLSFEEALPQCDSVLFLETEPKIQETSYESKMREALQAKKTVYLGGSPEFLSRTSIPQNMVTRIGHEIFDYQPAIKEVAPVFEIPVPIIYVLGFGPNTGKFDVQLELRAFFLKNGYSVSQIGSNIISTFFGFPSLPSIFEDSRLSIRQRMVSFNRYVYKKYTEEKPDLMIIGIPGGIFPLNSVIFEEMGEKAFLACQAVRPDLAVLCSYAHPLNQDYINEMIQICKYRLNSDLRYFAVSATGISILPDTQESEYVFYSSEIVEKEFLAQKQYDAVGVYNIMQSEDMRAMCDAILLELKNNF